MSKEENADSASLVSHKEVCSKRSEGDSFGCSSLVANMRELGEMPLTKIDEEALILRFGKDAHTDGLSLFRHASLDAINALFAGKIASKHFENLGGKGKDSKFGVWCETYGGAVSRTTIDRWRRMYEAFRDDFDKSPELFSNVQLSALYWLVGNGMSESQRNSFLEIARANKPVTKLIAIDLVPKKAHKKRGKRKPLFQKKKVSSRHFVCKDSALPRAIQKLLKSGYSICGTVVACFKDSNGQARHLTLVSGVKHGPKSLESDLGSWFSVENSEDAILECKGQVRERFGESALERFSVLN